MLTYEEFCKKYPPSFELQLECLYDSIEARKWWPDEYKTQDELIEKEMLKEYDAYCQLIKQKGLTEI